MYKESIMSGYRYASPKGSLTTEQLFSLSEDDLDKMAIELEASLEKRVRKSFIREVSTVDKVTKTKFNVVLDVLATKYNARVAAAEALSDKRHNEKILTLIADKQEDGLKNMSEEQLKALLR